MAAGKWKVFSNVMPIGGEKMYTVGRQKDLDKPLHSGNIEYGMMEGCIRDKEYCEKLAAEMNEVEERTGQPYFKPA